MCSPIWFWCSHCRCHQRKGQNDKQAGKMKELGAHDVLDQELKPSILRSAFLGRKASFPLTGWGKNG
jgi:hypothetical protein